MAHTIVQGAVIPRRIDLADAQIGGRDIDASISFTIAGRFVGIYSYYCGEEWYLGQLQDNCIERPREDIIVVGRLISTDM
eukprot:337966-Prymnesium_polylepis.2